MPEFELKTVTETPYAFVTRTCSWAPESMSEAMGRAYGDVWTAMQTKGIAPAGGALSVYYDYDPETVTFRAGFIMGREDMAKATGEITADVTPSGEVLHFVHKGSYKTLRDDYALMMEHVEKIGRKVGAPTWEIYVNDPSQVPEAELLTEIYSVLA